MEIPNYCIKIALKYLSKCTDCRFFWTTMLYPILSAEMIIGIEMCLREQLAHMHRAQQWSPSGLTLSFPRYYWNLFISHRRDRAISLQNWQFQVWGQWAGQGCCLINDFYSCLQILKVPWHPPAGMRHGPWRWCHYDQEHITGRCLWTG